MIKIVLTGHSESGKAELFARLRQEYPEAYFIDDPVSAIYQDKQQNNAHIDPAVFGKLLIARSLFDKKYIPKETDLTILHSSLLDVIPFAQENGCSYLLPRLIPLINAAGYTLSLECDPTANSYSQQMCNKFNISTQDIPQTDIEERTTIATRAINSYIELES